MPAFHSPPYGVDLYQPGAVDPTRFQVVFTDRKGATALISSGDLKYGTTSRSCTCVDFTLEGNVCQHMKARDRAFRKFAREYRLKLPEAPRPLWAEDVGD